MKAVHGDRQREFLKKYGYSAQEILDFSQNINFLGPPVAAIEAIKTHLPEVTSYPDSEAKELRQVLAKYLSISPKNLLLGNGSAYLIYLLASYFGPYPVLVLSPTFAEYELAAKAYGAKVEEVKLDPDKGFAFDLDQLLVRFKPGIKVFLGNPNNPTGNLFSREFLLKIAPEVAKVQGYLVVDEAFMDFVDNQEDFSLRWEAQRRKNLVVLGSLTKFFALPGLRLGYLVAPPDLVRDLTRQRGPWNVNVFAQVAGKVALEDTQFIKESQEKIAYNREYFRRALDKIAGLKVYPSQGNYLLVKLLKDWASNSPEFQQELAKKGVLIRDCSSFKSLGNRFIRLTVRSKKDIDKLVSHLKQVILEKSYVIQ